MPPIGVLTGGVDLGGLRIIKKETEGEAAAVTLNYGQLIQDVVDFLIIAFCIFVMVRTLMKLTRKKNEAPAPAPEPEPTKEEKLLTEIRDILAKK